MWLQQYPENLTKIGWILRKELGSLNRTRFTRDISLADRVQSWPLYDIIHVMWWQLHVFPERFLKIDWKRKEELQLEEFLLLKLLKLTKGPNSGNTHSSMASVWYYRLPVKRTVTERCDKNPMKTAKEAEETWLAVEKLQRAITLSKSSFA